MKERVNNWYLSKKEDWNPVEVVTPRTREKISFFYDYESDTQYPILQPPNTHIKVYEYGRRSIWGGEILPTLVVASPHYALYYDPSMKKVFLFRGKTGISKAFTFAKNMANRHN